MNERRGLWSPLSNPYVYEIFHHLIGARAWLRRFTEEVIRPQPGERLFDIGCGPGALLGCLPADTKYTGFDRNEAYIERARRMYGARGEFICDDLSNFASYYLAPADVAVAIGILHHLDDDAAVGLLHVIAAALKPGGRLITVDPCIHPDQSRIQHFVVSHDRGKHVRPFDAYLRLGQGVFPEFQAGFKRGYAPFPYSICVMRAATPSI